MATTKDYVKIAEAIKYCKSISNVKGRDTLDLLKSELAVMFKAENKNFNTKLFFEACNYDPKIR